MTDCLRFPPLVCLLALAGAAAPIYASAAAADAVPSAPPAAEAMVADLRAADAARAATAREWQDWQVDSERMYALLDGVQAQADRLLADAAEARDDAAKIANETDAAGADRRRNGELFELLSAQAAAIRGALAHAATRTVPGTVAVPPAIADDPAASFAAAVRALEASERAGAGSSVELVEGRIDGATRAVTMLRVSGQGWWTEIDGPRAGIVEAAEAGQPLPRLKVIDDAPSAAAIRRAIGVVKGGRAPEIVRLPLSAAAIEVAP